MKENIEDYRKDGFIDLDEYFRNNPSGFVYPYYMDGYDEENFWAKVRKGDEEKFIYVKPRNESELNNDYNVYSELIYEELLNQVGIQIAEFDMAKYNGSSSTISENVLYNYNQNEFIINGSELFGYGEYDDYNLEDLFNSLEEYAKVEYVDNEQKEKCIKDIQKVCIADIFTLSTDRKPTDFDFIVGKNDSDEEVLKLAPLCHNTYSLGANFSIDEMYDMLDNEDMLADRVDLCYSDTGVPDYKRDYNYSYWEDSLFYLIDENEENYNFARECATKMDINKAIKDVESKIKSKIPIEYKEFMGEIWDNRLQNICECIDLDYYKIKDGMNIEREEI